MKRTVLFLYLFTAAIYSFATAQFGEFLYWNGEKHTILTCPLELNIQLDNLVHSTYNIGWKTTACWRGYIGHWSIKEDELYLDSLCYVDKEYNDHTLIPDNEPLFAPYKTPKGIKASWVSNDLRIVSGNQIMYLFDSHFEKECRISLNSGNVVGIQQMENRIIQDGNKFKVTQGLKEIAEEFKNMYPDLTGLYVFKASFNTEALSETPTANDIEIMILRNDALTDEQTLELNQTIRDYLFRDKVLSIYYINNEYTSEAFSFRFIFGNKQESNQ